MIFFASALNGFVVVGGLLCGALVVAALLRAAWLASHTEEHGEQIDE